MKNLGLVAIFLLIVALLFIKNRDNKHDHIEAYTVFNYQKMTTTWCLTEDKRVLFNGKHVEAEKDITLKIQ